MAISRKGTVMGQVNELKSFTRGQIDAVLMKIGQDAGMGTAEGIRAFLRSELTIVHVQSKWQEVDGIVYFEVTSDGTTGTDWVNRLRQSGFTLSKYAEQILCSQRFKSTNGVTTQVAVLKGTLFNNDERFSKTIRASAHERGLTRPTTEVACLIREKFTDKELEEMGLQTIVVMHEQISDSLGDKSLLGVDRYDNGRRIEAYYADDRNGWIRETGFAFTALRNSSI